MRDDKKGVLGGWSWAAGLGENGSKQHFPQTQRRDTHMTRRTDRQLLRFFFRKACRILHGPNGGRLRVAHFRQDDSNYSLRHCPLVMVD
jgi:hypothetical protein